MIVLFVMGMAALVAASPAAPQEESPDGPEAVRVYFTEEEAIAKAFAKADSVWSDAWAPTPGERAAVEARLGMRLAEDMIRFWRARRDGHDLGHALILEEKGRFKPITFLVHVEPDGGVGLVLVMVYRESRGDGVRRQRFLRQFRGQDIDDPLRLNRDVVGLTGATLSSRALAAGVRKALVLVDARYGGSP